MFVYQNIKTKFKKKCLLCTNKVKTFIVRFAKPQMFSCGLHGTAHVTLFYYFCLIPVFELYNIIIHPEPELQGAGVVKAEPHKGTVGVLNLQLSKGLSLFIEDGGQISVIFSAVVQCVLPYLVFLYQREGGFLRRERERIKESSGFYLQLG